MSVVTRKEITAALGSAGVASGDTLMVHTSFKSFGSVEGGPEAVIDAVLDAVGLQGHVVMPTLTSTYVPEVRSVSGLVFNPRTTPSRVGVITDLFWRRPQAVRSAHPTHSVACIGPRAAAWMAGHDRSTTFDWDGPYGAYVKADGGPSKLVFLGVKMVCNTTLHAVEDWLKLPYMAVSKAMVEVDGVPRQVEVSAAPHGCRGFYQAHDRHHQKMEATGLMRRARAGAADISVLDARACVAETMRQELETPGALLCVRPNCLFCTEGRSRIVPIQEEIRVRAAEVRARGLSS